MPTPAPDTHDHLHRLELAAPTSTTLTGLSDLLAAFPTLPVCGPPDAVTSALHAAALEVASDTPEQVNVVAPS